MQIIESDLSKRVIGCLIEVHRELGPGLLESTYERCLAHEFELQSISAEFQKPMKVRYKGIEIDIGYRADVVVEGELILELKTVEALRPVHEAQLLGYLKQSGLKQGFLVNFHVSRLKDGLKSFLA